MITRWNEKQETQVERFQKHYADEDKFPLSEKEKEIFERWRAIYGMMLKGRTNAFIIPIIKKEYQVSEGTVRNDINGVQSFFGSLDESHKAFRKGQYRQFLLEDRARAIARGNDAAAIRCSALLMKLDGLDRKEDETIDFTKFEQHTYQLNVHLGVDGKATILNLDKPDEIPADLRDTLVKSITPQRMSAEDFRKKLNEEIEDAEVTEES